MAELTETLEDTIIHFLSGLTYSKTSEFDIPFKESNGITGKVTLSYIYSEPFRSNPEKKILVIKRIEVNGSGVVTPTLRKILENDSLQLTEVKIESIQNKTWLSKLEEKGWTIEEDYGVANAFIKKGGRKNRRRPKQTKRFKRCRRSYTRR